MDSRLPWILEEAMSNAKESTLLKKFCEEGSRLGMTGADIGPLLAERPEFADCIKADQRKKLVEDFELVAAYQMGRIGAAHSERERLLFEQWMQGHCWKVGNWIGTHYEDMTSRVLFAAWRDRAALGA